MMLLANDFKQMFLKLKEVESHEKRSLIMLGTSVFLVLLSYPLIRSVSTSIFLNAFGAKSSPIVWMYSVVALTISIFFYNRFQQRLSIHRLFLITTIFTVLSFIGFKYLFDEGNLQFAYAIFVWKEVYVVLMIHMIFGLVNASISEDLAKIIFGPMGACGALGGIVGGLLTSWISKSFGIETTFTVGVLIIALSAISYHFTSRVHNLSNLHDHRDNQSPIESIADVKKYVFLMAVLVIITQFVINLANFKFNVIFHDLVPDKTDKTIYLGKIYTGINLISLTSQLILIPIFLRKFSLKSIHFGIPTFFGGLFLATLFLGPEFWTIALFFVGLKGVDYSFFSTTKELLYFPLLDRQKFGAKYIVDMFCYRFGKGLISFILIFIQSILWINSMIALSLMVWGIVLLLLFREKDRIQKDRVL